MDCKCTGASDENVEAEVFYEELNKQIEKICIRKDISCSTNSNELTEASNGSETLNTETSENEASGSSGVIKSKTSSSPLEDSLNSSSSGAFSALFTSDDNSDIFFMSHKGDTENDTVLREITEKALNVTDFQDTRKRKSDIDHGKLKFISLAEGVRDFHIHTPARFHSHPKGKPVQPKKNNKSHTIHMTIPQSPKLLSKTRSRHIDYPSAEEREKKEIEEIQSYKLEIHPLDPKIFEAPRIGKRVAKPPVVVEPFNLTEYKKKEVKDNTPPFLFKARPVPKALLEHPVGVPEKKELPLTTPSTPSFITKQKLRFKSLKEVDNKTKINEEDAYDTGVSRITNLGKTLVQPFSFEKRDKMMLQHKKEKIEKVFQEEREARNFHANPVPNYIKKITKDLSYSPSKISVCSSGYRSSPQQSSSSLSSPLPPSPHHNGSCVDEETKPVFKARPASVLYKTPFVPKKPDRSTIEADPILLHTQERAEKRKEYNEHIQQHFQDIEAELQRRKELEEKQNREEELKLRQQAVHKAQPIRSYKPLPLREKIQETSPNSPNFSNRFKK